MKSEVVDSKPIGFDRPQTEWPLVIGKNLTAKTPLGDFQVTTPETPLLSLQAVTSKESQVPYQPTVEPLPQYPIGLVL